MHLVGFTKKCCFCVELKGKFFPVRAMKTFGGGGCRDMAARIIIINLATRSR